MTISIQVTTSSTPTTNKIKRNLFGPLNHDLLAQDLNDMWKDTIDRQINKWNFDFAQLCPLKGGRYEWSHDDEAQTTMPEFYKIAARIKTANLNPSPKQYKKSASTTSSRSPSLTPSSSTSSLVDSPRQTRTTTVKFDMILRDKSKTPKKSTTKCPNRKRRSRLSQQQEVNAKSQQQPQQQSVSSNTTGLIITYSEHRKDTLRSAAMSHADDCHTSTQSTRLFKQQSLLGMSYSLKANKNFMLLF
jgi:hypothetical protein